MTKEEWGMKKKCENCIHFDMQHYRTKHYHSVHVKLYRCLVTIHFKNGTLVYSNGATRFLNISFSLWRKDTLYIEPDGYCEAWKGDKNGKN